MQPSKNANSATDDGDMSRKYWEKIARNPPGHCRCSCYRWRGMSLVLKTIAMMKYDCDAKVTVGHFLKINELGLLPPLFPNETLVNDMDHLGFGMGCHEERRWWIESAWVDFGMLSAGLNGLYMFCLRDHTFNLKVCFHSLLTKYP